MSSSQSSDAASTPPPAHALPAARSPSADVSQAPADQSVDLQNAHFGALGGDIADTSAAEATGNAETDGAAPPPAPLPFNGTPSAGTATAPVAGSAPVAVVEELSFGASTLEYGVSGDGLAVAGGQLKLKDGIALDSESEPTDLPTVSADAANRPTASQDIGSPVIDRNEAPVDISLSNATVDENAAGAVIGTLATSDPDTGDTHTYTVSDDRFEVVNGQLKLKDGIALDHEGQPNITIAVTSTDGGGLSVVETFTITVANVNERPTDIALSSATIAENAGGAVVGTLSAVDADQGDTYTYAISDGRFEIVDGQLKLKAGIALDHESTPTVTVTVTATDGGGPSVSKNFTITVGNVNEAPTDIALSNATIAENETGAVVGALITVDPDAGDTHAYTVSDARFEVVGNELKLRDGVSLNHEAEPSVTITVTATDANWLSVNETFTVSVANVNETPTDIALSNATIAENALGAVVGTLSTVDPDAGETHNYTVSDARFEVAGNQLKLKDGVSLDHEAEPNLSVTVTATDSGGLSVSEDFAITVANVNETPTDIALSSAMIDENATGAVVGTLSATDPDAGDTHSYAVSDSRFEIVGDQLKLKAGISLDHEAEPTVTVSVTATDAGGLSVSEDFAITVANVNETPTDIALSNATVDENAAGAVVGTLSTADPDAGDTHSYAVSDARFEVVGNQLQLKAGASLDHEAEPTVTVSVTATDAGGLSVSEDFAITVANINETPTDIALSNATVDENAAGAVVGTLSTADPDAGDTHSYAVSDARFEVVGNQLQLKAGASLDHEAEPTVTVSVTATDAGGLSVSEDFAITVGNVNETPTDIALSNATVDENAAGAVVGTLSTADPDAGDTHSYAVSDARFEVVGNQLQLKAGMSLNYETTPSVNVTVTATDASGLTTDKTFAIAVANVNESPTDIALSNASVSENSAGAAVGTLSVVDQDVGATHTYAVSDSRFEVVGNQLKLKAGASLDREAAPTVTVTVTATDNGGLTYSEDFAITVTNVNEAPTNVALSNASVSENSAGAIVGLLSTTDPDAGDTFTYTVSDSRFEVAGNQLKLKTGVSLDYEATQSVTLNVTARDAGGLTRIQSFTIAVNDLMETISGTSAANTLTGTIGMDRINGLAGNDTINAQGGNDVLVGGTGNDTMNGGDGSDTYEIATGDGFDTYNDTGTSGTDRVVATAANVAIGLASGFGPASGIEEISSGGFANVVIQGNTSNDTLNFSATALNGIARIDGGSGNDAITGSAGGDAIVGGAGNDTIAGGGGNDTIEGGTGNDTLSGDGGIDTLSYAGSNAAVTVNLATNTASGGHATGDRISNFENVTGSSFNDTITGDANANVLAGGAGNDTLSGAGGNDTIQGGAGGDTLDGGAGADTLSYAASTAAVTVNLATSAVSGGDAAGDRISNFENLTGSSFADALTGNAFDNFIDGGAGNDWMSGGAGNDVFRFTLGAGADTVYGGLGVDTIRIDTGGGSGGWLEAVASPPPTLAAGDWLLQLDTGEAYILHGAGGTFDFGGVHAGLLTATDGSTTTFQELEGVQW